MRLRACVINMERYTRVNIAHVGFHIMHFNDHINPTH